MSHNPYPGTMTTGEPYTGIQQYKGMGQQKWCPLCGEHRPQGLGWKIKFVGGLRTLTCPRHQEAK